MLQSINHLHGFHWPLSRETQHDRGGRTIAEEGARIPSLSLLATLLLIQCKLPLAYFARRTCCWFMLNLLSTKTFTSFPQKYFAANCSQHMPLPAVVPAWVQDMDLCIAELCQIPVNPFLHPWDGSTGFWCVSHASQFCAISKLTEVMLCPLSGKDRKR